MKKYIYHYYAISINKKTEEKTHMDGWITLSKKLLNDKEDNINFRKTIAKQNNIRGIVNICSLTLLGTTNE